MVFRQKRIWIFTAVILLIAAGIMIAFLTQNTEKSIHKGTLVQTSEYRMTAGLERKVPDEEYTPVYKA